MLIENPEMTQVQFMEKLNLSRKQVQKEMKELCTQGLLVREGTNRSGRWIVKDVGNDF